MLMTEHKSDIEHILHDLDQIEYSEFDDRQDLPTIEHSRQMAKDASRELMDLIRLLEEEERVKNSLATDPKLIEDMCVISYYMSMYRWENLIFDAYSLEDACIRCAELVGCNPIAILNIKAVYDEHNILRANGWGRPMQMPEDMEFVKRHCDTYTENEVFEIVQRILGLK